MFKFISNWLDSKKVKAIYLMRKDRLTTGYVSYLFVDGKFNGYALDTFGLNDKRLSVPIDDIVVDEFTEPRLDNRIVLEPSSRLDEQLASVVDVDIDSSHMALEC